MCVRVCCVLLVTCLHASLLIRRDVRTASRLHESPRDCLVCRVSQFVEDARRGTQGFPGSYGVVYAG
eukprot:9477161-Pyramimonas_sp.AAC.1